MPSPLRNITLPKYFGMPPESHVSENIRFNSMPVLEISPHVPDFSYGLTLFRMKKAWTIDDKEQFGYHELLALYGYELDSEPLRIAFLADSFPTDSFTNEYSESQLNRITDVASQTAQEIAQMVGVKSVGAGLNKIKNALGSEGAGGALSGMIGMGQSAADTIGTGFNKMFPVLTGGGSLVSRLATGARVDFPLLWRNSAFQPSYSVTCRLYNPAPGDDEITEKYIIGPIAAILCLCLPQSKDGYTYSWPFLHKIKCKGFFDLGAAYISNVSIIKGGDQQQIAWNKRLGIVDVRIDFGGLYASMLTGEENPDQDKSSLTSYLAILKESDDIKDMYADPLSTENSTQVKISKPANIPSPQQLANGERNLNINEKAAGQPSGYKISGPGYKETVTSQNSKKIIAPQKQNSYTSGGADNVTDNENFQSGTVRRVSFEESYAATILEDIMPM